MREVCESCWQSRRVGVEFAPEVYAAIESIVGLESVGLAELSFKADVVLVTLRDAKVRVKAARESVPLTTSWQSLPRSC